MRVSVIISASHSELLSELEATPLMDRAERLRVLASIGLATMRNRSLNVVEPGEQSVTQVEGSEPGIKKAGDTPAFGNFVDSLIRSTIKG